MRQERYFKLFKKKWKMNEKQSTKYFDQIEEERNDISTSELRDIVMDYSEELLDVLYSREYFLKYFLMVPIVLMGFSMIKVGFFGFMTLFFAGISLLCISGIIYYKYRYNKEYMDTLLFEFMLSDESLLEKEDKRRGVRKANLKQNFR